MQALSILRLDPERFGRLDLVRVDAGILLQDAEITGVVGDGLPFH